MRSRRASEPLAQPARLHSEWRRARLRSARPGRAASALQQERRRDWQRAPPALVGRWRMPTARSARSRTAQGCAQTPVATGAGRLASRWSSFVSAPSRERQADQSLLASSGPLLSLQLNNPCQRHLSQRVSEDNVVFWNVDAVMHGRNSAMSAAPSVVAVPTSDRARSAEFRRRRAAPSRGRRRLATCAGQGSGAPISRAPDARG